ncbi:MAG: efflux RND transporter periplasmic adaptor subunit [Bacteroidia bacterium]
MNKRKTLIVSLIILVVAGAITAVIFLTEPDAERAGATKKTPMLVDVTEAQRGTFRPVIIATGIVQPTNDIVLSPRVSGEIISLAKGFMPGGFVKKNEVLLQIDPADYRNELKLRQSELSQVQSDLQIEQGRQDVARQDYELVEEMLDTGNEGLMLRQPQLRQVQAQVEAMQAAAEQAELNLERTVLRAPFDAHILSRNVNVGSQVAPGDDLGRMVGRDEYWVVTTVPLSKLPWITFPSPGQEHGSEAKIVDNKAWKTGQYRNGHVFRLIGALEDQTRMARLLISVSDPLAYKNDTLPVLMINSFVEARIHGEMLSDVIRLNRDHLRENETVWVMEKDQLQIRKVEVIFMDADYAYIASGINAGEQVVTTNLSTVAEGAPLRTAQDKATGQLNNRNPSSEDTGD